MQNELKERALDLIGQYSQELATKGLTCEVTQKYSQSSVSRPYRNHRPNGLIIDLIEMISYRIKRSREKEQFKGQPNRYYTIVLQFIPSEKSRLKKIDCKEYAFLCKKISRCEQGFAPKQKEYEINKILNKIEKRICKTLSKADTLSVKKICKNTLWDSCRYINSEKYHHVKRIFGTDRKTAEFVIAGCVLALGLILSIVFWIVL